MAELTANKEQSEAIEYRGGSLLISAGAGSGKTRVLVERLVSRIFDSSDPCDIDEFLVVTFTRAAAAELRERIKKKLRETTQIPEKTPFSEGGAARRRRGPAQLHLADTAEIGTIHSFCGNLAREYAHLLGIAPDFRIAEESETIITKSAVMSRVLDARYANPGDAFNELADLLGSGGTDDNLVKTLLDFYGSISTAADFSLELQNVLQNSSPEYTSPLETKWGSYISAAVRDFADRWIETFTDIENDLMLTQRDEAIEYIAPIIDDIEALRTAASGSLSDIAGKLNIGFPELRKKSAKLLSLREREIRSQCRNELEKLREFFAASEDECREDLAAVSPVLYELTEILKDFHSEYTNEKQNRNTADFSDLEQFAAKLLLGESDEAASLRKEISGRYKEVLVDEYQDVSPLQDAIVTAAADGGRKLTMVGDARQSIYSFRGAEPTIFISKFESDGSKRVVLSKNYRSSLGVLDAVNAVFSGIMSKRAGDIDYSVSDMLIHGRDEDPELSPYFSQCELHVLNIKRPDADSGEEADERESGVEAEAKHTAGEISRIIGMGIANPSDIVILLRSANRKRPVFEAALKEQGVPFEGSARESFFERREVLLALSFLRAVDNPSCGIDLSAVMLSGVYAFSADELASIVTAYKKHKRQTDDGRIETDLLAAAELNAKINEKTAKLMNDIRRLRMESSDLPADEAVIHIFGDMDLYAHVSEWDGGESRRRSLQAITELASDFTSREYKTLGEFLVHIDRMIESEIEPKETKPAGNGVRIMTIHESKGLEFPVVFLPCLGSRFNDTDLKKPVIYSRTFGIGMKRRDAARRMRFPTTQLEVIKSIMRQQILSEEMRLLYVAMTRAKEKLVMVCGVNLERKKPAPLANYISPGDTVPNSLILSAKNIADPLYAVCLTMEGDNPPVRIIYYDPADSVPDPVPGVVGAPVPDKQTPVPGVQPAPPEFAVYAHPAATDIPAKMTVTGIGALKADEVMQEAAPVPGTSHGSVPGTRPRFITESSEPTGAERGTTVHAALRYIDFDKCMDTEGVKREISRLIDAGTISGGIITERDIAGIGCFFESDIGHLALSAYPGRIMREFKFSRMRSAVELYDLPSEYTDEMILFQGIIDLVIETDEGLIVVDFKSDYIKNESDIIDKTQRYECQVCEYVSAIEHITDKKVISAGLFFLSAGVWSEIKP